MSEREYIAALERDLKAATERMERLERELIATRETIKATVALNADLSQRLENMRQIACQIAKRTNQQQRIAAGEKE